MKDRVPQCPGNDIRINRFSFDPIVCVVSVKSISQVIINAIVIDTNRRENTPTLKRLSIFSDSLFVDLRS
jgi:uncharacterized protein YqfB (UPF0267 family)